MQKVFTRFEKKYLPDERQYEALFHKLLQHMEIDEYGLHEIRNIYYDTKDNELIRFSLEKPEYKEKFRIRCYGEPDDSSDIFLEIKKKYRGIVNKRRIALKKEEADAYLEFGVKPKEQGQIWKEIDFFLKRYLAEPVLYLAYNRIALYGKEDAGFRVTFDTDIRSRRENLTLCSDEKTRKLQGFGNHLMEVKTEGAMPLWFVKILSELEIRSVSFSKYGRIYQDEVQGGRAC